MYDQLDHLSGQTFGLPVILRKKNISHHYVSRRQTFFHFLVLLAMLVRSSHCNDRVIVDILTGQKRYMTLLKILWPVNTTGNKPKLILSPDFVDCVMVSSS